MKNLLLINLMTTSEGSASMANAKISSEGSASMANARILSVNDEGKFEQLSKGNGLHNSFSKMEPIDYKKIEQGTNLGNPLANHLKGYDLDSKNDSNVVEVHNDHSPYAKLSLDDKGKKKKSEELLNKCVLDYILKEIQHDEKFKKKYEKQFNDVINVLTEHTESVNTENVDYDKIKNFNQILIQEKGQRTKSKKKPPSKALLDTLQLSQAVLNKISTALSNKEGGIEKKIDKLFSKDDISNLVPNHIYDVIIFTYRLLKPLLRKKATNADCDDKVMCELALTLQWGMMTYSKYSESNDELEKFPFEMFTVLSNLFESVTDKRYDPNFICYNYPNLIIKSNFLSSILYENKGVQLYECQKDMINILNEGVDSLLNYIQNFDEILQFQRTVTTIMTGLATGKSTIASIIPVKKIHDYNRKNEDKTRVVIVYSLPSKETAIDFAVHAQSHGNIWIATKGEDNENNFLFPMHECCPHYVEYRSKKEKTVKHYSKVLENIEKLDLSEQYNSYKMFNYLAVNGQRIHNSKHKLPDAIFCDVSSLKELLKLSDTFKEEHNVVFLPIIDEAPATGDLEVEFNPYIDSMKEVIENLPMESVIISASFTEDQINSSKLFEKFNKRFVTGGQVCNSFTQIFTTDDSGVTKPSHPLMGVDPARYQDFLKDINSTMLRLFPPKTVIDLIERYNEKSSEKIEGIKWEDILHSDVFLMKTKSLLEKLGNITSNEEAFKYVVSYCPDVKMEKLNTTETQMHISAGNVFKNIISGVPEYEKVVEDMDVLFNKKLQELKQHKLEINQEISSRRGSRQDDESSYKESLESLKVTLSSLESSINSPGSHSVTYKTKFGSTRIKKETWDKISNFDKDLVRLLLSGVKCNFRDSVLDGIVESLDIASTYTIDSIGGMYGRNIDTCSFVKIIGDGIGRDSIIQAAARAGRTKEGRAIVYLVMKEKLLSQFGIHNPSIRALESDRKLGGEIVESTVEVTRNFDASFSDDEKSSTSEVVESNPSVDITNEDDIYTDPKLRDIVKSGADNIHVSDGNFQGDKDVAEGQPKDDTSNFEKQEYLEEKESSVSSDDFSLNRTFFEQVKRLYSSRKTYNDYTTRELKEKIHFLKQKLKKKEIPKLHKEYCTRKIEIFTSALEGKKNKNKNKNEIKNLYEALKDCDGVSDEED